MEIIWKRASDGYFIAILWTKISSTFRSPIITRTWSNSDVWNQYSRVEHHVQSLPLISQQNLLASLFESYSAAHSDATSAFSVLERERQSLYLRFVYPRTLSAASPSLFFARFLTSSKSEKRFQFHCAFVFLHIHQYTMYIVVICIWFWV